MKQICFFTIAIQAQFQVNGIVKNQQETTALAFATITSVMAPLPFQM
jgi:hypothetical protein